MDYSLIFISLKHDDDQQFIFSSIKNDIQFILNSMTTLTLTKLVIIVFSTLISCVDFVFFSLYAVT